MVFVSSVGEVQTNNVHSNLDHFLEDVAPESEWHACCQKRNLYLLEAGPRVQTILVLIRFWTLIAEVPFGLGDDIQGNLKEI